MVGLRPGGPTEVKAQADGFAVKAPADAVKDADLVAVLTPDMVQKKLYDDVLAPNMKQGAVLLFAHGLNVHFDMIKPRDDLDVVLVAPKGPGALVRREYEIGRGVPCIWAVYQDKSGKAAEYALAYAAGLGGARANLIQTTFKEETETDLFGEQAVLCGGASALVQAGFETLVEAGYQPEIAYYEVLHELKLIVDLFYEGGISRMLEFISETAQYGDYVSGPRVIDAGTKERMKEVLKDIRTAPSPRTGWPSTKRACRTTTGSSRPTWSTRSRRWARNCAPRWSGCKDRPRKRAALPTRFARFPMNSSTHRSAPPNGARWLTQALEAEGVGTLFGYPVAPSCRSTTRWWIRR